MAVLPLTYLEKRWASGYGGNSLVDGATQTNDRRNIAPLDRDTPRNISAQGRRTLQTLARWLYWNSPVVRGAIAERSNYATSTWVAQFAGEDKAWGTEAEAWLRDHNRFCNIRGGAYTYEMFLANLVTAIDIDGEQFVVLTEDSAGVPKLQVIPSHRIGSRGQTAGTITDGPFSGRTLIDGIIVDEIGREIGARFYHDDSSFGSGSYTDLSANDYIHAFWPDHPDQLRGISRLGATVFKFQDVDESNKLELLAQKMGSSYAMEVHNEDGEVDSARSLVSPGATAPDADGKLNSATTEKVDGISVHYFRAGSSQGIKAVQNDRPSGAQQDFRNSQIREALHGIGWSFDFSLDPTKIGGAPLRVVVEKLNRNLASMRRLVIKPVAQRIDGWRVSKAVKNGFLTGNAEWFRWNYQGPADLTADQGYATDAAVAEVNNGFSTPQREIAKRGGYWEEAQDESIAWAKRLAERCAEEGVEPGDVYLRTPNGNPQDNDSKEDSSPNNTAGATQD